jgi:hypothetical protein
MIVHGTSGRLRQSGWYRRSITFVPEKSGTKVFLFYNSKYFVFYILKNQECLGNFQKTVKLRRFILKFAKK